MPALPNGHKQATTDGAQIRAWWAQWPNANVGVKPGPGLGVIDVDTAPERGGSLEALGELPPTWIVRTGGGGWHVWFRLPEGRELENPGKGFDLRQNDNGIVIAPGSVHYSGRLYEWQATPGEIAPAPDRFLKASAPRGASDDATFWAEFDADERKISDERIEALAAQLEPHYLQGRKHEMSKQLGGWLRQRGWSPQDVAALITRLPSERPTERAKAALAAFSIAKPYGYGELVGMLGDKQTMQAIETWAPNPKREEEAILVSIGEAAIKQGAPLLAAQLAAAAAAPPPNALGGHDRLPIGDIDSILEPLPPVHYIVPRLDLCPGAPALIAGYGFSGKTIAAQQLALDVALGRPVWGLFPVARAGKVLHIDFEQGRRLTDGRYQRLARAAGVDKETLRGRLGRSCFPPQYLDRPEAEAVLVDRLTGYDLVIIDSLRASAPSLDENSSDVRRTLDMLARVSERTGAAIVVIHHARKPAKSDAGGAKTSIRGSGAIFDACSSVLVFEGREAEPTRVTHEKARTSGQLEPAFALTIEDVDERAGVRVVATTAASAQIIRDARAQEELAGWDRQVLAVVQASPPENGTKEQLSARMSGSSKPGKRASGGLRKNVEEALLRLEMRGAVKRVIGTQDGARRKTFWVPTGAALNGSGLTASEWPPSGLKANQVNGLMASPPLGGGQATDQTSPAGQATSDTGHAKAGSPTPAPPPPRLPHPEGQP